jgi:hypothetical protein
MDGGTCDVRIQFTEVGLVGDDQRPSLAGFFGHAHAECRGHEEG